MVKRATRKMRGGAGNAYSFGAPIVPGVDAGNEVLRMSSCQATPKGYEVSLPAKLGLPGFAGGGRRRRGLRRKMRMTRRRTQRGGRYSFDLSYQPAPAAPWAGGIPNVVAIPCEAARSNPLNPPLMRGGGLDLRYIAPTAGYGNQPSSWTGSTGAPVMVQTPYEARTLNPACLKTGGGKRRSRRARRRAGSRKH